MTKIVILTALLSLFTVNMSYAKDFNNVEYLRTIDGDTIKVNILDIPATFGKDVSIRLRGIDAEELKSKTERALLAKKYTKNKLDNSNKIILKNCSRGSFFKLVCDVYYSNLRNLNDELLKEDLADKF